MLGREILIAALFWIVGMFTSLIWDDLSIWREHRKQKKFDEIMKLVALTVRSSEDSCMREIVAAKQQCWERYCELSKKEEGKI